ncbi:hypothetical protein FOZ63_012475 [Perkinsus olseni]|uniref:N-acetyltransferase domain-containing protein n=1 Tax=Perkinsus olseni TaxID=32597 RepID=A0A7J6U1V1_PEROL|nr:hypothetical protein FOZ63_012475 [Perkinsus olseni]
MWPGSAKTLHQFATTLHRADRLEEARELYLASLAIFDDNALTDYCVAQIDIETNRFDEAHERFVKILNGNGIGFGGFNRFLIMVDFGFTLTALKRYDEAIPVLKEGLSLNEDVPHALNALGISYLHMGEAQRSVEAFQRGIHYDPENPWLWSNLAAALLIGDRENTASDAKQCAALAVEKSTEAMGFVHPKFVTNYEIAEAIVEGRNEVADATPQLEFFFHRLEGGIGPEPLNRNQVQRQAPVARPFGCRYQNPHVVGRMLSKISRKEELKEEEKLVVNKISAPPEGLRLCLKKEAQQGCYSVKKRPHQLGYLKWISVDEDWRERGIGTNLLRKGIQSITESWPQIAALWLKVERNNRTARRLYRRLDFKHVGESKGFYIYAKYFTPSKPDTPSPPTHPRTE